MNKKDWIAFQNYRQEQRKKLYSSKLYKEMSDMTTKVLEPKVVKHKFLWWNWKETQAVSPYTAMLIYQNFETVVGKMKEWPEYYCPEETVEECLNWLITKHGKRI